MAWEPKVGQGSAFPNRNAKHGAPDYKGSIILPDGSVLGLAIWEKDGKKGRFLSISVDDREGAYQAQQLGRDHTALGEHDDRKDDRREQPRRQESRYRDDRQDDRRNERPGDSRHAQSRHNDRPSGSRYAQNADRRGHADDLDDDIPF